MSKRSITLALTVLAWTTAMSTGCSGRQFERAVSAGAAKTSTAFAKFDDGVRSSATTTGRAFADLDSGSPRWVAPTEQRHTDRCSSRATIVIYRERPCPQPASAESAACRVDPANGEPPVPPLTAAAARAARERLLAVPVGDSEDALWVAAGLNRPPPMVVERWPISSEETPYMRAFLAPGCELVWRRAAGGTIFVAAWCEGPGWQESPTL